MTFVAFGSHLKRKKKQPGMNLKRESTNGEL